MPRPRGRRRRAGVFFDDFEVKLFFMTAVLGSQPSWLL
jgi:hypothetical protein